VELHQLVVPLGRLAGQALCVVGHTQP
jgi:hypothetical protein